MQLIASLSFQRACSRFRSRDVVVSVAIAVAVIAAVCRTAGAVCRIPDHFQGEYYCIDNGEELTTLITNSSITNELTDGSYCDSLLVHNDSIDAQGRFDATVLLYNRKTDCYQCFIWYHRTINVLQVKHSTCVSRIPNEEKPTLESVCSQITPNTDIITMFRTSVRTVNCKYSIEGTYHFTYEVDYGGGGICDSPDSVIVACQQPGSVYVDNQVFEMNFGECEEVSSSLSAKIKFLCMGTWRDEHDNYFTAMADISREKYRERFRCMLTRLDQQTEDNFYRYSLSRWASCASLKSPYDGPIRLIMSPAMYGIQDIQPTCLFPRNFSGVWTKGGEYDSVITINNTHIHFATIQGQFWYRDTVFTCQQTSDTRYLTTAVNVGRCEVDYVCWDIMPRHHSVLRWRLGRSFPMEEAMSRPDHLQYAFRRACSWSMFTLDRDDAGQWIYSTFILNPPIPVACPVGGRYVFKQYGRPEELYWSRIRGITERPRHQIDCNEWVSVIQSCSDNPSKMTIDVEYCATLDHTGRPIGEYDLIPDREMSCVGYWQEDLKSYLITFDYEDPFANFRCWVYERLDWRHVIMSKTSTPWCGPDQTAWTYDPLEFGAVHLDMIEAERLFDQCPQRYTTGADPYEPLEKIYVFGVPGSATNVKPTPCLSHFTILLAVAVPLTTSFAAAHSQIVI